MREYGCTTCCSAIEIGHFDGTETVQYLKERIDWAEREGRKIIFAFTAPEVVSEVDCDEEEDGFERRDIPDQENAEKVLAEAGFVQIASGVNSLHSNKAPVKMWVMEIHK